MNKRFVACLGILSILGFFTVNAFPWGSAVHVYIAFQIKGPDVNALYGAAAPDLFNYFFEDNTLRQQIYDLFHWYPELVWGAADTPVKKALAWGFISHGHTSGADITAHLQGVRFGKLEGYVIEKARVLDSILERYPEYAMLKQYYPDMAMEVAHNILENGLDVMMKRLDPAIGRKIAAAASSRADVFPRLLAGAYGPTLGAMAPTVLPIIGMMENVFRVGILLPYGQAFMALSEEQLLDTLSMQMASMASAYLPEGFELPVERAYEIIRSGSEKAMTICQGTFFKELEATIRLVQQNMTGYVYSRGR